jgi:hypothetical protein
VFQWCVLLTAAVGIAVGGYVYLRLDDEIRRQVECRIAEHYPDLSVQVGRARFDQDRGIAIFDVGIVDRTSQTAGEPILAIEEMYLAGNVRMEELLTSELPISEIVVRRATLRATRYADGRWSVSSLTPVPSFGNTSPTLRVQDATLIVEDEATPGAKQTLKGIQLTLTPANFEPNAAARDGSYHVEGVATGLPAREFRFGGDLCVTDGSLNVTARASGVEISAELLSSLPIAPSSKLAGAEVSGRADATIQISRANEKAPLRWSADVALLHGRFNHSMLPEPLTEMGISAQATPERLIIKRLDAKLGSATIALAAERVGWSVEAPLAIAGKVVGFRLSDQLSARLPESMARVWGRFRPFGLVDAEVRLNFDGRQWSPQLTAACRGISLTDAERFPYVVEQATGSVVYRPRHSAGPDELTLDLTGVGGGRPIRIQADLKHLAPREPDGVTTDMGVAQVNIDGAVAADAHTAGYRGRPSDSSKPRPHPVGWVQITGVDIPLHEDLVAAIPGKGQPLVRSLQAQGMVDFLFRSEWKEITQPRADVSLDIRLKECAIRYAPFPLPLRRVGGLVTARNWTWTIQDVQGFGANDDAVIKCAGNVVPRNSSWHAELNFTATTLPLDDNLKSALSPAGQQAWNEINPQGRIDLNAHVTHHSGQPTPHVEIRLQPHDRSVSVQLAKFPYRLEQVEGEANYQPGRVELRNVLGRHDREIYTAENGLWSATPDGGWQFAIRGLNIDRLTPHREFVSALPQRLQMAIERLQPSGTFGVYSSSLNFAKAPNSDQIGAAWDISIDCHQAVLRGGLPLQSMTGGIRMFGRNDSQAAYSAGELDLNSVVWKDIQLTNVRGPIWVDPTMCLFGEQATMKLAQPPRRLTADAYGGSLAGSVAIRHDNNPSFQLELALGASDLARFANERLGGPSDMNGTVSGTLLLSGTGPTAQSLNGSGELHVVDANIYELPVLVSMLKVLKNRTPNSTAFNRCDMKFTIQGEHVYFQQLNLLGDAVSLYGKGETGFDRQLDLVFYTLPEPANLPIPLWRSIVGQVSQQTLQLNVVGTWDKAEVNPETLPGVNQMLEQIQSEFQGATNPAASTAIRDTTEPR